MGGAQSLAVWGASLTQSRPPGLDVAAEAGVSAALPRDRVAVPDYQGGIPVSVISDTLGQDTSQDDTAYTNPTASAAST